MKILLLLVLTTSAVAQSPSLLSIHLRDAKSAVASRLKFQATFEGEEEGQQVWELLSGPIQHVIIGYDREDKVRYVTTVGTNVPCEPLAASPKITGKPPDVTFVSPAEGALVSAHGSDRDHLASCSIKNPQAHLLDPDQDSARP